MIMKIFFTLLAVIYVYLFFWQYSIYKNSHELVKKDKGCIFITAFAMSCDFFCALFFSIIAIGV